MNYELAKELKDAGFYQNPVGTHIFPSGELLGFEAPSAVYLPTLSELIEACGKGFAVLIRDELSWRTNYSFGCKSPEEAVARLWLALNKKS